MHRSNVVKIGMKALALVALVAFALMPVSSQAPKSAAAPKIPTFKYDGRVAQAAAPECVDV